MLLLLHQIHLGSYVSVMSTKTMILLFLSEARAMGRCADVFLCSHEMDLSTVKM